MSSLALHNAGSRKLKFATHVWSPFGPDRNEVNDELFLDGVVQFWGESAESAEIAESRDEIHPDAERM